MRMNRNLRGEQGHARHHGGPGGFGPMGPGFGPVGIADHGAAAGGVAAMYASHR